MFNLLDLSFALHCYVWTSYRHQFDWIITEHIEHTVAVCYARLYTVHSKQMFLMQLLSVDYLYASLSRLERGSLDVTMSTSLTWKLFVKAHEWRLTTVLYNTEELFPRSSAIADTAGVDKISDSGRSASLTVSLTWLNVNFYYALRLCAT